VILSINRHDVDTPSDVSDIIDDTDKGDVVLLELQRRDKMKSLVALEVK
jgi:hypothetical protein